MDISNRKKFELKVTFVLKYNIKWCSLCTLEFGQYLGDSISENDLILVLHTHADGSSKVSIVTLPSESSAKSLWVLNICRHRVLPSPWGESRSLKKFIGSDHWSWICKYCNILQFILICSYQIFVWELR